MVSALDLRYDFTWCFAPGWPRSWGGTLIVENQIYFQTNCFVFDLERPRMPPEIKLLIYYIADLSPIPIAVVTENTIRE
jgi:hypothetical protein